MARFTDLPNEILIMIFSLLPYKNQAYKGDFWAFCLVNRLFNTIVTPFLYHTVILYYRDAEGFINAPAIENSFLGTFNPNVKKIKRLAVMRAETYESGLEKHRKLRLFAQKSSGVQIPLGVGNDWDRRYQEEQQDISTWYAKYWAWLPTLRSQIRDLLDQLDENQLLAWDCTDAALVWHGRLLEKQRRIQDMTINNILSCQMEHVQTETFKRLHLYNIMSTQNLHDWPEILGKHISNTTALRLDFRFLGTRDIYLDYITDKYPHDPPEMYESHKDAAEDLAPGRRPVFYQSFQLFNLRSLTLSNDGLWEQPVRFFQTLPLENLTYLSFWRTNFPVEDLAEQAYRFHNLKTFIYRLARFNSIFEVIEAIPSNLENLYIEHSRQRTYFPAEGILKHKDSLKSLWLDISPHCGDCSRSWRHNWLNPKGHPWFTPATVGEHMHNLEELAMAFDVQDLWESTLSEPGSPLPRNTEDPQIPKWLLLPKLRLVRNLQTFRDAENRRDPEKIDQWEIDEFAASFIRLRTSSAAQHGNKEPFWVGMGRYWDGDWSTTQGSGPWYYGSHPKKDGLPAAGDFASDLKTARWSLPNSFLLNVDMSDIPFGDGLKGDADY